MRILVTGAAGFIGTHLVKRLIWDRHEVYTLDINTLPRSGQPGAGSQVFCYDITDEESMKLVSNSIMQADAVVHLAAIAAPRKAASEPHLAWDTNVRGTCNILRLATRLGAKKFIFASSAHVYGISPKYMPTDEEHPLSLLDTYTVTKIVGEQLCQLFHKNYGLSYTTLRLFNAYGPGQSKDYFLGVKLEQAARGGPITLMNAKVTKDWVWVEDVVDAMARAVLTSYVGPLNVGTGIETSLEDMALMIGSAFDVRVTPEGGHDSGPTHMRADRARAYSVLGWAPQMHVIEGVKRLIAEARK